MTLTYHLDHLPSIHRRLSLRGEVACTNLLKSQYHKVKKKLMRQNNKEQACWNDIFHQNKHLNRDMKDTHDVTLTGNKHQNNKTPS